MDRTFCVSIVLVVVVIVVQPSGVLAQQAAPSGEQIGIGAGLFFSVVGSGVCALVNGRNLVNHRPGAVSGTFGVLFGVSTMGFLAAAKSSDEIDVPSGGVLGWGSLAATSIVLGFWSIQKASSTSADRPTPQWSFYPLLRLEGSDNGYGVGMTVRFQ